MECNLHGVLNKMIKCYDSWHGRLSHVDFSAIEIKKDSFKSNLRGA